MWTRIEYISWFYKNNDEQIRDNVVFSTNDWIRNFRRGGGGRFFITIRNGKGHVLVKSVSIIVKLIDFFFFFFWYMHGTIRIQIYFRAPIAWAIDSNNIVPRYNTMYDFKIIDLTVFYVVDINIRYHAVSLGYDVQRRFLNFFFRRLEKFLSLNYILFLIQSKKNVYL